MYAANSTAQTKHFQARTSHRGLRADVLEFILSFGDEFHVADAICMTVFERHLPAYARDSQLAYRARDWILVIAQTGQLITCYRRKNATRYIRHKPRHQPVSHL